MELHEVEKIDGYAYRWDNSAWEAVATMVIGGVAYEVTHESEMYCGQAIRLQEVPMPIVCIDGIVIDGEEDTIDGWAYTSNGKAVFVVTSENCECGGSTIDKFSWVWNK